MANLDLHGIAASPGLFIGRTLVAEEPGSILAGARAILVIRAAGVDWLETILKVGAVLTEDGGRTSHAATICRELGKPCVTSVKDAMRILRTGTMASVDGGIGHVTVLIESEADGPR